MQADPLGAAVLGELRPGAPGWEGPWGAGVRPDAATRVRAEARTARPERDVGERIR